MHCDLKDVQKIVIEKDGPKGKNLLAQNEKRNLIWGKLC